MNEESGINSHVTSHNSLLADDFEHTKKTLSDLMFNTRTQ